MSENKPIIFIDTVQVFNNKENNQVMYDSRVKRVSDNVVDTEKLLTKINLLDKRAQQGHFVSILVETKSGQIEGEFQSKQDNRITILGDQDELSVDIDDIFNISITKV